MEGCVGHYITVAPVDDLLKRRLSLIYSAVECGLTQAG